MKQYETELFESYGVVQKEYVTVPNSLLANTKELKKYFLSSYEYAQKLKAKPTKKKARRSESDAPCAEARKSERKTSGWLNSRP